MCVGVRVCVRSWNMGLGSITDRCSGNEPALLPRSVKDRGAAEIEPRASALWVFFQWNLR